jgi:cellulose synthase/poly-beta-1,6-N-acetylglucosamine synthase-like glycosyltransferase
MITLGTLLAWSALAVIIYVYGGYPAILWCATRVYRRGVRKQEFTPKFTLLISAFNEEDAIAQKIENTLALDYPRNLLEIIVVSDSSTDRTDDIVLSFAARGVNLLRMRERGGKTVGLNAAMQAGTGEFVLFSDANIFYRPDVLRQIAANFADPEVGCVTGDSRYSDQDITAADIQEKTYWSYEQFIRAKESELGSTVGGDGAIFAIRKALYSPLPPDTINDLVIPLQIVAKGYRAVFEPRAIGIEPTAGNFHKEFRRKQRIVNRSWRGVMRTAAVLNPFRVGIFAWQVWSHKMMRWLVPVFLLTGIAGCVLARRGGDIYDLALLGIAATAAAAILGSRVTSTRGPLAGLSHAAYYFYLVNAAAILGIIRALTGRVDITWSPERATHHKPHTS